MKLIQKEEGQWLFELDNSSLELMTTCPRAAELYIIRRRQASRQSMALNFGTLMHAALEKRMRGEDGWEEAQLELVETLGRELLFDPEDYRDVEYAKHMLKVYNETWPYDAEPFKVLDVEQPFRLGLGKVNLPNNAGEVEVVFAGRIDAIVSLDNRIYILDHKTTSIDSSSFFDDFILSSQVYGYKKAVETLWNMQVYGFYLDAMITRRIPVRSGKGPECRRQRFAFDEALAAEWQQDLFCHIETFLGYWLQNYFPKSPKWCHGKYGRCQFFDVCSLGPEEQRNIVLSSDLYSEVTWDPTTKNDLDGR